MSRRLLILVAIVLAVLVCLVYVAIAAILMGAPRGDLAVLVPGITPTALPMSTPVPRLATVSPSATSAPVPVATATPTVPFPPTPTRVPTALPTPAPQPPPTATRSAPATPLPPTPIPPALYQLDGSTLAWPDCGWTGVSGVIRAANGQPLEGIQVRAWSGDFSWSSEIVVSNAGGSYSIRLDDKPTAGRWLVQVVENGPATWNMRGFETSVGCQTGLQRFQMNWRRAK